MVQSATARKEVERATRPGVLERGAEEGPQEGLFWVPFKPTLRRVPSTRSLGWPRRFLHLCPQRATGRGYSARDSPRSRWESASCEACLGTSALCPFFGEGLPY